MPGHTSVELPHSRIVRVHALAEFTDAIFDHLVGMLLIPQHHLHEVELALDEAASADV